MTTAVPAGGDSAPRSIRLAIAEDHRVVADAMATMLGFGDGIEVVGVLPPAVTSSTSTPSTNPT